MYSVSHSDYPQIDRLKAQLSQQESSKRAQGEELEKLRVQLETLKKEEREYKQRVRERGNHSIMVHHVYIQWVCATGYYLCIYMYIPC